MSFFGMGAWEISIILIAALVIFGPDRLPEMAGKLGKQIRDLRQMSTDLTSEFEKSAGVQEFKSAVQGELTGVKSQVNSVTNSVKRDLDKAGSKVSSTAKSTTTSSTSSTASKVTGSTTAAKQAAKTSSTTAAKKEPAKATKKDPLADLVFFEEVASPAPTKAAAASTTKSSATPASAKSNSTSTSSNGSAQVSSVDQIDALSRARQRRAAAGYNRRPA